MVIQKTRVEEFDEFVNLPENADKLFEFIGGEIVEVPSNSYCSELAAQCVGFFFMYLRQNNIAHITTENGGYMVSGERYAPDVALLLRSRQAKLDRTGYNQLPPDLAVEVISPNDKELQLSIKIANYLAAGTTVWVIVPEMRQVIVYAPGKPAVVKELDDTLDGGDILPGFTVGVREIFEVE